MELVQLSERRWCSVCRSKEEVLGVMFEGGTCLDEYVCRDCIGKAHSMLSGTPATDPVLTEPWQELYASPDPDAYKDNGIYEVTKGTWPVGGQG